MMRKMNDKCPNCKSESYSVNRDADRFIPSIGYLGVIVVSNCTCNKCKKQFEWVRHYTFDSDYTM